MKDEQTKARPEGEVRIGYIRAAIWRNEGKSGAWFNVTIDRTYRDENDEPRSSNTFGRDDLLVLAKVVDLAHTRVIELQREERTERD
jgi:hypothetical protein